MSAFAVAIKDRFNPQAVGRVAVLWHADIARMPDNKNKISLRITDFNSAVHPLPSSKFCDLRHFRPTLVSKFFGHKPVQKISLHVVANDSAAPPQQGKRNIFQPYRFG